jgi:hypothetical protein
MKSVNGISSTFSWTVGLMGRVCLMAKTNISSLVGFVHGGDYDVAGEHGVRYLIRK